MLKDEVYCNRGNHNQMEVQTNNEKLNHLLASGPRCCPTLRIFDLGEEGCAFASRVPSRFLVAEIQGVFRLIIHMRV